MKIILSLAAMVFLLLPAVGSAMETISLTQTHCQFIEAESEEFHFTASSPDQCKAINAKTSEKRLRVAQPLRLKAGDYVFRVKNRDVPYELGFWLRGAGILRWRLPNISGGGIVTGSAHDYAISLQPGEYRYSCPLNLTPDYVLIVE